MVYYFIVINLLAYAIMWVDKVKSIYKWWRISEKTLWLFAIAGGVFGIWLGMIFPLYHKAGKLRFRLWIPVIAVIWLGFILYISLRDTRII